MRVMLLTADYPPDNWSGIGQAVERQAHGLTRMGAEVHVLYPASNGSMIRGTRGLGPCLHKLHGCSFPTDPCGFDWIHLHSLALAELALEIRRRTGTPLAYTAHSVLASELAHQPGTDRLIAAQNQLMQVCDAVVFLSRSEREAALRVLPELSARSVVIGNAVPAPPEAAGPWRDGLVVFAGRFARTKGIATLCDLLPRLRAKWPGLFVLAGGHGDIESCRQVQALAAQIGSSCHLAGWLGASRLERLFARASLVLVPSEYEPFGMVALEAMRMGAPVLAAKTGGLAEVAGPGSGAMLVASRDPQEWLEHSTALLENPELSSALRRRGPLWTTRHFSETKIASQLLRCVYAA